MADDARTQTPAVEICLRIPGVWRSGNELIASLPEGYTLDVDADELCLPDGARVSCRPMAADDQFAQIFLSGCQRPPSQHDRDIVERYTINVCLRGPGGSFPAAARMLRAGAAIVRAGAAGVFIDNSLAAHPSEDWLKLSDDPDLSDEGGWGGAFWAFSSLFSNPNEVWSLGMNAMGLKDAVAPRRGDVEFDSLVLNNFLAFSYRSGVALHHGDVIGPECAPGNFRVLHEPPSDEFPPDSPVYNPLGRWRIEPLQNQNDIATTVSLGLN